MIDVEVRVRRANVYGPDRYMRRRTVVEVRQSGMTIKSGNPDGSDLLIEGEPTVEKGRIWRVGEYRVEGCGCGGTVTPL